MRTRPAPGVDRLIVIAYDRKTRALPDQQLNQLILAGVSILIFIHQQITNFILPALAHLIIALQQQRRQQNQIIKIENVTCLHMGVVKPVAVGKNTIAFTFRPRRCLCRRFEIVFPVGDRGDQLLQQNLVVFDQAFGQLFEQGDLVGIVKQ
ncbi:hypothetical protein NGUA15_00156 [Salmonella enterica]|nr:hypothetical protein NGUA15_00156 [Salmonella enterica]